MSPDTIKTAIANEVKPYNLYTDDTYTIENGFVTYSVKGTKYFRLQETVFPVFTITFTLHELDADDQSIIDRIRSKIKEQLQAARNDPFFRG